MLDFHSRRQLRRNSFYNSPAHKTDGISPTGVTTRVTSEERTSYSSRHAEDGLQRWGRFHAAVVDRSLIALRVIKRI